MENNPNMERQFIAIYEAESDAIYRFCLFRVSDKELALDLAQETFARLWQTIREGKEMTNVRAFLYTVAQRIVIDWYRRRKSLSLESLFEEDPSGNLKPMQFSDGSDALMDAEGRFLIDSLAKVSEANQKALYLRFVEGLLPAEIGKILGFTANVTSVRITRGLEELRKITGYSGLPKE